MFLRFVVRRQDPDSRSDTGIFTVAGEVQDAALLEPYQHEHLEELLAWFNRELPAPSRAGDRNLVRAICWFKEDASEFLAKVWELVALLRDIGETVELVKTSDPGIIVQEDEHQVFARPLRHDRKTPR